MHGASKSLSLSLPLSAHIYPASTGCRDRSVSRAAHTKARARTVHLLPSPHLHPPLSTVLQELAEAVPLSSRLSPIVCAELLLVSASSPSVLLCLHLNSSLRLRAMRSSCVFLRWECNNLWRSWTSCGPSCVDALFLASCLFPVLAVAEEFFLELSPPS